MKFKSSSHTSMSSDYRNDHHSRPESCQNPNRTPPSHHHLQQPQSRRFSSKKSSKNNTVSMNHLLNFTFPSRPTESAPIRRRKTGALPIYNKEKFINANFRFVLKPFGNYMGNLIDSDLPCQWEDVVQVMMQTQKALTCPICLDNPICPKMTKCGHVFCFPCILHYLELSETSWRKCPICYDSVYSKDVKSVFIQLTQEIRKPTLSTPTSMAFTLVQRAPENTIYLPAQTYFDWKNQEFPPDVSHSSHFAFSRHLMASNKYILDMVSSEIRDLEARLLELESEASLQELTLSQSDIPFVQMSLQALKSSQETMRKLCNQDMNKGIQRQKESKSFYYYFYMSNLGLHYYLHPLDIRILKQEYEEYERFPREIHLSVMNIQESTIDEATRKRWKYLGHLPLSLDVSICEIDWSHFPLSLETRQLFSGPLEERQKQRLQLEKQESAMSLKRNSQSHMEEHVSRVEILESKNPLEFTEQDFPAASLDSSNKVLGRSLSPDFKGKSFAQMAQNVSSSSTPWSAKSTKSHHRAESEESSGYMDDYHGWTLDLEDILLSDETPKSPSSSKKSSKHSSFKKVVVSNGGARMRRD